MLAVEYFELCVSISLRFIGFLFSSVCELFLFYLRGVSFARVIVSRNGNLYLFTNLHYFYSCQSGNYHILYGIDRRNPNELYCVHLNTIWVSFC